eukprot:COSAG05_NODE_4938_length_1319_cov_1.468852_1_plen_83_part_00
MLKVRKLHVKVSAVVLMDLVVQCYSADEYVTVALGDSESVYYVFEYNLCIHAGTIDSTLGVRALSNDARWLLRDRRPHSIIH